MCQQQLFDSNTSRSLAIGSSHRNDRRRGTLKTQAPEHCVHSLETHSDRLVVLMADKRQPIV
jgi:hypothetical protein